MSDAKINFLKQNEIDVDSAISYMGDYETYNEILLDFYNGLDEQLKGIDAARNDMPNYAILVHALKSNARCLGITSLSEVCYQHEMESKANNINYVNENYINIVNGVNKVKEIISNYQTVM